ncbi:MAG TPA: hypothetical protein DIU00_19030 [Phycisphaerales bacterium]|nr:hypothetical protein [Phycisphaerales bacterium]
MTYALTQTRLGETNSIERPSRLQEWNNREFLTMLNRRCQSLREGRFESFQSDLATSTDVGVIIVEDSFWKTPFVYIETMIKLFTDNDTCIAEEPEQEISRFREKVSCSSTVLPISVEDQDLLEWDVHIETPPPPHRSGTIKVRFKYIGRSKPIPIDDPWA